MTTAALTGFATGLSLILAIGAQNAFVLRQGLMRAHVLPVVLVCAVSDAILIAAGVAGIGTLTVRLPLLEPAMRLGGAAFLLVYGALRLRAAFSPQGMVAGRAAGSARAAVLTALAFTWANPHVYLDTLVLIGAVAASFPPTEQPGFAAGAITASFVFFFALGYGARLLAPVFARPRAWAALDAGVGLLMWAIAAGLLLG